MPHSTGHQLPYYLLALLALASPLLAQGDDDTLAPVIELNPRHQEAESVLLEEPKSLIVVAEMVSLPTDTVRPTVRLAQPPRDTATAIKPSQPQPAVRTAVPFDPTAETRPRPETGQVKSRQRAGSAGQDAASLGAMIRVYAPILPAQRPRVSASKVTASTDKERNKPAAQPSPSLEAVHRSNSSATRTNRLASQSSADRQPSVTSPPQLSGLIQIAKRNPVSGTSELEKPQHSAPRKLAAESPRKTTPLVTQAARSPIETRKTEASIASSPKLEVRPARTAPPNKLLIPREQTIVVATVLPKRSSPVVELATNPIVARSHTVSLTPQQALVSKPEPVLELAEETLPQRPAPREAFVPAPAPTATARPVIQLADAKPLLAVLQPSPSPSDLPVPREELPLSEEQIEIERGIEALELDVKPINELSVQTKPEAGELPTDYASSRFAREGKVEHRMGISRSKTETIMMWEAPALCHRPLYFEDINLERHGYRVPLVQPAISAAHFFGRVPLLPYMMVSEGHRNCQYTLGHYRPGDYAPYSLYIPRLRLDASTAEAAVVMGVILAFP